MADEAVDEHAVPSASNAREAFIKAMDTWDDAAADVAVAAGSCQCKITSSRHGQLICHKILL